MSSILYIGMDVHKESYTLRTFMIGDKEAKNKLTMPPDVKLVLKYIAKAKELHPHATDVVCGYEAGCLGYSLYHQLTKHGITCKILAPTTMAITNNARIKNDDRDAGSIARDLAYDTYSAVYVPTAADEGVRDFIRMRNDHKKAHTVLKQQINAFVLRHGKNYDGGKDKWTKKHVEWLHSLKLGGFNQETLDEYLVSYKWYADKIERLDKRIEELALDDAYNDKVKRLTCLLGVKTLTALSVIVEIGDFKRFAKAEKMAAFLGLVPGEDSSGGKTKRLGITKAGNSNVRRLLVEAAHSYTRGKVGYKSKELKKRQDGNTTQVIAYADKANERLRRKFYHMTLQNNVKYNVAVTAVARELACFMWGLMTENIS